MQSLDWTALETASALAIGAAAQDAARHEAIAAIILVVNMSVLY